MAVNRHFFFVALLFVCATLRLAAQGTAFNYQGRLNDGGAPANGTYDLRFAVYDAVTNGSRVSFPLTNSPVAVSNGLFAVTLDFGAGIFTGTNYWLDIAVRTNGGSSFIALFPRQPILPVPYAIFANSASNLLGKLTAAQFSGNLPASQIAGASSNVVSFTNLNNAFSGTFTGNGAALSNLNASQLTTGTVADARLSANVPLLNANQTFSGANTFIGTISSTGANEFDGANTFTNLNNSFSGSFFGNGLVGWGLVYGTTTNAAAYHGYLLLNPLPTTVTLPTSANSPTGSIVRVAGGAGGWAVKVNAGQSILGNFSAYASAALVKFAGAGIATHNFADVAVSANGVQMFAVGAGFSGVYGSADGGANWVQLNNSSLLAGTFTSVACSANGKIVFAQPGSGNIYKSTDGGLNWAVTGTSLAGFFIACTADGTLITTGNIACSGNAYRAKLASGAITISTNSGTSFGITVVAPASGVTCLAASSDCTRLLAGVSGGLLYASANMGTNWTALSSTNQLWSGAWMSPDGSKLAATVSGASGNVFSAVISPLPNTVTTNSITGSQGGAVELQYIGNNQFMPVSSTGSLWAN